MRRHSAPPRTLEREMPGPPVRYWPRALPVADAQLSQLITLDWRSQMHARRTASFGVPYNYSGQVYPEAPMPPVIVEVAERAAELAGHRFDNCLGNLYESGNSSMGFHSDSYDQLVSTSWIAIASFGATRSLVFRSNDRSSWVTHDLEHGSILLMNRETQLGWTHAVPTNPGAGLRISLTSGVPL